MRSTKPYSKPLLNNPTGEYQWNGWVANRALALWGARALVKKSFSDSLAGPLNGEKRSGVIHVPRGTALNRIGPRCASKTHSGLSVG